MIAGPFSSVSGGESGQIGNRDWWQALGMQSNSFYQERGGERKILLEPCSCWIESLHLVASEQGNTWEILSLFKVKVLSCFRPGKSTIELRTQLKFHDKHPKPT